MLAASLSPPGGQLGSDGVSLSSSRPVLTQKTFSLEHNRWKRNEQTFLSIANTRLVCDCLTLACFHLQIRSQLKHFPEQGFGPPQTMCQLKVVTDRKCLETVLKFGKLSYWWFEHFVSMCRQSL